MEHLLFSYGTLRQPDVQAEVFGREVPGEPDAVVGHRLGEVEVDDPHVVAISGSAIHPGLVPTADEAALVHGTVLTLDDEQLARADAYEIDAYRRVRVALASGRTAWVYALTESQEDERAGGEVDRDRQPSTGTKR